MSIRVRLLSDTASPDIKALARAGQNTRPLMQAIGVVVVSTTKRAFNQYSLRQAPWRPKKDGSPATLKKNAVLFRSIRVLNASKQRVTVGSDRPYAAVHQMGGKHMPRRPFFPFDPAGRPTRQVGARIRQVVVRWVDSRGKQAR